MVERALVAVEAPMLRIEIDAPMGIVIVEMRQFERLVDGEVVRVPS